MGLEPGRFGPFDLIEPLGRGGMGEVWLARARSVPGASGALCVVKTVRSDVADDADAVRRFQDESRLAVLLVHPRIGRVIDAGSVLGTRYLALELVEGVDLQTLSLRAQEQKRAIPDDVALWIAACAFDAVSFAHAARHPLTREPLGVVHRDMSPHNVMCDCHGSARVIDFGLALSTLKQAKTEHDVVLGKLAYLSPEQARGERVDARCDIYATGLMLYELLARERYWGKLSQNEIWPLSGAETWEPMRLQFLDEDIAAVLRPMIERRASRRAADAASCRDALAALLHARGGAQAASRSLRALVEELAAPELARIREARGIAEASLPPRLEEEHPPTTESIAVDEEYAIRAAQAEAAQTLTLPAFTTMMMEAALRENAGARSPGGGVVGGLADAATVIPGAMSARFDEGPASVTARIPVAAAPAARKSSAPFVAAGALLAVVVVAAVLVVRGAEVAPQEPPTAALAPTPPPPPTPTTTPPPPPPPPPLPLPTPTTTPTPDPLGDALASLRGCQKMCAKTLRGTSIDKLDAIRAEPRQLQTVLGVARNCQAQCRR